MTGHNFIVKNLNNKTINSRLINAASNGFVFALNRDIFLGYYGFSPVDRVFRLVDILLYHKKKVCLTLIISKQGFSCGLFNSVVSVECIIFRYKCSSFETSFAPPSPSSARKRPWSSSCT